jgi:ureidoglycolate hydrolase
MAQKLWSRPKFVPMGRLATTAVRASIVASMADIGITSFFLTSGKLSVVYIVTQSRKIVTWKNQATDFSLLNYRHGSS